MLTLILTISCAILGLIDYTIRVIDKGFNLFVKIMNYINSRKKK